MLVIAFVWKNTQWYTLASSVSLALNFEVSLCLIQIWKGRTFLADNRDCCRITGSLLLWKELSNGKVVVWDFFGETAGN